MGLLAPLFLLGSLAIALPVWLHRLKTQSSEREQFASAMLLETAEERVHVRRKLKYLLLLALRILFLALLAAAFAQPFLERPPSAIVPDGAGTHLVLIDSSASMGRTGVFEQALAEARRAIGDAPAGAAIQVIAAADDLIVMSEPSTDKSAHRNALSAVSVSAMRLDYGAAMQEADQLAATLPSPVTLHFVSDYQASAMPVRFADLIAANVHAFVPHPVGTGRPNNWSIDTLRETADGIEVGVRGEGGDERVADVSMILNGAVREVQSLSGKGSRTARLAIADWEEGDNRVQVQIETDDDLAADNQWYAVIRKSPPAPVPVITSQPAGLPVTYLSAALESAVSEAYRVETLVPGEFDTRVLSRYRWAVLDDIGVLDPLHVRALGGFLERGGSLLAFTGERALDADALPLTGHRLGAASLGAGGNRFLSIGQVESTHPVLSATEGWHSVNVSRSMPVETGDDDRVLVRLQNGEPFILERPVAEGRILLVLNGLDTRWNDLPVHPVFVSFVVEAARYLSGTTVIRRNYLAGSRLPLSLVDGASGQVVDPDGNTVLSLADTTRAQQIKLDKPGFYEVYIPQGEALVAANIDPRESELEPIPDEVLERWREASWQQQSGDAGTRSLEAQPEQLLFAPWLLLIMAFIVIAESMTGNAYVATRARS